MKKYFEKVCSMLVLSVSTTAILAQDSSTMTYFNEKATLNNTVSRDVFMSACEKSNSVSQRALGETMHFADKRASDFYSKAGIGAVSELQVLVSKEQKCLIAFRLSGVHEGTSIKKLFMCEVFQLKKKEDGSYGVEGINYTNCY